MPSSISQRLLHRNRVSRQGAAFWNNTFFIPPSCPLLPRIMHQWHNPYVSCELFIRYRHRRVPLDLVVSVFTWLVSFSLSFETIKFSIAELDGWLLILHVLSVASRVPIPFSKWDFWYIPLGYSHVLSELSDLIQARYKVVFCIFLF